jgi:hypothetical protein
VFKAGEYPRGGPDLNQISQVEAGCFRGRAVNFPGGFITVESTLIWLNRFNQIERELNTALGPNMADTTEGFNEIVAVIEQSSAELRRDTADQIFAADRQDTLTTLPGQAGNEY